MMLITADLHAHNWSAMSSFKSGISSRLYDLLKVIEQMIVACIKNDVTHVIIIGDIFHERGRISVPVQNLMHAKLKELATCKNDLELIIVTGNHDHADREGKMHSVYSFSEFATIVDTPSTIVLGDVMVACLPYREKYTEEDLAELTKSRHATANIMVAHTGLIGASGDNGFDFTNGYRPEDLKMDKYDRVFVGHYHAAQRLNGYEKIRYVGSPIQHSFADEGIKKSFTLYDPYTDSIRVIKTYAPIFKTLEVETAEDLEQLRELDQEKTMLKIIVKDPRISASSFIKEINYKGRVTVEVIRTKRKKKRLSIDAQSTPKQMIEAYVKAFTPEGLNKEELLRVGLELASNLGG